MTQIPDVGIYQGKENICPSKAVFLAVLFIMAPNCKEAIFLRGCIGRLWSVHTMGQTQQETHDWRARNVMLNTRNWTRESVAFYVYEV